MALEKQTLSVSFTQGLDTKDDPKQVPAGKLLSLQNGYFQTPGMIRKRPGFASLGVSGFLGCATYQSELVAWDRYTLRTVTASGGSAIKGDYESFGLSSQSVAHSYSSFAYPDSGHHSLGYRAVTYNVAITLYGYKILDEASGASVATGSFGNGSTSNVKAVQLGNYFLFVYTSSGSLFYQAMNMATGTWSLAGSVSLASDVGGGGVYDVVSDGTNVFIAYTKASGMGLISLGLTGGLSGTIGVVATKAVASEASTGPFSVAAAPDLSTGFMVCYYNGTAIKAFTYDPTLTTQLMAPTVQVTVSGVVNLSILGYTATTGVLYYTVKNATVWKSTVVVTNLTGSGGLGGGTVTRGCYLAGKILSGNVGIVVVNTSTVQPTYFVFSQNPTSGDWTPVAQFAQGTGPAWTNFENYVLPDMQSNTGGFQYAYLQADQDLLIGGSTPPTNNFILGVRLATFNQSSKPQTSEIGSNLHFASGLVTMYDGQSVCEHNFLVYPENVSGSLSATGGNLSAGAYQWVVCFEWTDNQGQVHRSAPSIALSKTATGSTSSVTLTMQCLNITARTAAAGAVQLVVYRTAANGTIFYRDGAVSNVYGSDTVTYISTVSDATIQGQLQLYTTSGEVDNSAAPASLAVTTYKSRLCLIPAENPYQFWFSKQVIPGSPVEFSALFTQNFDAKGGPATALMAMDDKLVVFKQSAVFAIVGEGPSVNGQSNDFTTGQLVSGDVGALTANSVVLTPQGIMFQSAKGICLLDRSLSVSYVGAPVESYNSQTVVSAVLHPAYSQVRFAMSGGQTLVYDYQTGQWSVFTNPSALSSVVWNGTYTYVKGDGSGTLLQESSALFTDQGSFYALKLQTSWLQFAGLQGFQRIYKAAILGDYKSAHTLQVQLSYDDVSTPEETVTVTPTSTPPYQWRLLPRRQKCSAIQLTIQDVQSGSFGEGFDISGLTFEVGMKPGLKRIGSASSFG